MEIKYSFLEKEKVLDAWPDHLTYQGKNLFSIYMKNIDALIPLADVSGSFEGGVENTQDVYLGYSFEKDVFIVGFDIHGGSSYIVFKIDSNEGMIAKYLYTFIDYFYEESESSGYSSARYKFKDLIDIRLN